MIESENIVNAVHWLAKFRVRITVMLLIPLAWAIVGYFFADDILKLISIPLKGQTLFFMTPVDGVMAKIKVALFGGVTVSLPVIAYLIVSMFSSRLTKKIKRSIYFLIIPFGTIALAGGIVFAYKFIMPTTIEFLLNCGTGIMNPMISGSDYVSFSTFFLLSVGLVFELPLVLVGLSRVGVITYKMLAAKRKVAIILIVIILALLTPTPDAFTLLAVASPVVLLYEISVWWIFILEKFDRKKEKVISAG